MELLFDELGQAVKEAGVGRRKCGDQVLDILRVRCFLDPQVEALSRRLDLSLRFTGDIQS